MPKAYKRCVKKVAQKKGTKSAHAICTAKDAGGVKAYRKRKAKKK